MYMGETKVGPEFPDSRSSDEFRLVISVCFGLDPDKRSSKSESSAVAGILFFENSADLNGLFCVRPPKQLIGFAHLDASESIPALGE
mmetsp:Transcript_7047/g.16307  ORF Transcript_7047/g.16307 Transcript_7047/m.16307 type:complete len:87 (+) Transcript_7047:1336-1596(+)